MQSSVEHSVAAPAVSALRERRQTQGTRRADERVLMQALAATGALIALLDRSGRIEYFSGACERTSGYDSDEVSGRLFWACPFVVPDEIESISQTLRAL